MPPEAMAIFQSTNPPLRVDGVASPSALTQMGIYSGTDSEPAPLCLADARLGDTLTEAQGAYPLRHHACYTCYQYGTICSNASAGNRDA
jgi:hypothetical protein